MVREMNVKTLEGWGFPLNSKKAHYFIEGRSLCGKWFFMGELEEGNDESSDNCTACKKALTKRRARQALDRLKDKGKIEW